MTDDSSGSHKSPARLSGVSGSSSGSVVTGQPLEVISEVFEDLFANALGFSISKHKALMENFPVAKVFKAMEALEDGLKQIAALVHAMIGTDPDLVYKMLKRHGSERYADDLTVFIEDDEGRAKRFVELVGMKFYQKAMGPLEIYNAVMGTGWMLVDNPVHRGFAAALCGILDKHNAFGTKVETEYTILKAFGIEMLADDLVPKELRKQMWKAMITGSRRYGGSHPWEYVFDEKAGGVSYNDLALKTKLPLDILGNPFAAYIDRCGLLKTGAEKDSVIPPSPPQDDHRTGGFIVPQSGTPTRIVPPPWPNRGGTST
jgi:hypothetical protein